MGSRQRRIAHLVRLIWHSITQSRERERSKAIGRRGGSYVELGGKERGEPTFLGGTMATAALGAMLTFLPSFSPLIDRRRACMKRIAGQ